MEKRDSGNAARPSGIRGLHALAVVALVLVAAVPSLFVRDLWGDAEIRLTEGAREMVVLGDWSVPRLNGKPLGEEPPLPYWATAGLWRIGGGHLSARLLSGLSVGALLVLCYLAVAHELGRRAGLLTALIALTTATGFWHVRTGGTSPVLALFATAAVLAGYRAGRTQGGAALVWWPVAYGAMALAVLAGGSLGLLLPAATLLLHAATSGATRPRRIWPHLAGLVVLCAVLGTWAATCRGAAEGMGVLTGDLSGLWETVREGELIGSAVKGLSALLPWVAILPAAFMPAIRAEGGGLRKLAAVWLGVIAVPMLLGGESGYSYALQAAVPLAILCATTLEAAGPVLSGALKRSTSLALAVAAVPAGGILLLGLMHLAGLSHLLTGQSHVCPVTMQPYSVWSLVAALPFMIIAFLMLLRALFRKPPTPFGRAAALVSAMVLAGLAGDLFLSPVVDSYVSARPFAQRIVHEVDDAADLYLFRKDYDGIYNLHTGRVRIPVVEAPAQLRGLLELEGTFAVCEEKRLEKAGLLEELAGRKVAGGSVGGDYMMLLEGGSQ
jgi:hypothetical protein